MSDVEEEHVADQPKLVEGGKVERTSKLRARVPIRAMDTSYKHTLAGVSAGSPILESSTMRER